MFRKKTSKFERAAILSVAIAAGWQTAALAADDQAADSSGPQLQEVTVTANRRVENQQTVPIAITAVTAEAAGKLGIGNALSLGEAIPSVVFNRQSNGSIPFIRGIGNQNSTPGNEPAVAMYVDDVYLPLAGSGISNFNSISRLEVAKGPQGTLFGRNATGGVIQIVTRDPTEEPTVDMSLGFANYKTGSASFYISGGLSSTISANLAAYGSKQREGWGRNLFNGLDTFGNEYDYGARAKIKFQPNDNMSFLLTLDSDTTSTGLGLTYRPAPGTKTTSFYVFAPVPIPGASANGSALGFYDVNNNFKNIAHNYQSGASLKANFELGWASLVSITAYRHNNDQEFFDYDVGPAPIFDAYLHGVERTFTQEFRLVSPDDAALQWIAGVYYFDDTAGYKPIRFDGLALPGSPAIPNYVSSFGEQKTKSYAVFGQVTKEIVDRTKLTVGLRYTSDKREGATYNTSTLQAAVTPGNTLWPVCPGDASLGVTNPMALAAASITGACAGGFGKKTFNKPSGKIALSYDFTDDFMGYVAYNRGFKSGVFNVVSILAPQDTPVEPETVDAYSIGEKAEFMNRRIRVNAEAYLYKYKNMQVQQIVNNTSHTTNAAAATLKGVDIDIQFVPVQNLTLTASLGFEDSKFDDFPNGSYFVYLPASGGNCSLVPALAGGSQCGLTAGGPGLPPHYVAGTATTASSWNLKGNKTPNVSPFSSALSARYTIPVSSGEIDLNLAWNHAGKYYFSADNGGGQIAPSSPEFTRQPQFDLINASVGWTSKSGNWGVKLWGKNLGGEEYLAFMTIDGNNTQWSAAPPRTYGVTFSTHF